MKSIFLAFLITFIYFGEVITQQILEVDGVKHYFSYPKQAHWFKARAHCIKLGLDLVEINSATKQEALNKVIRGAFMTSDVTTKRWWLGIIRAERHPYFTWANTGMIVRNGYTNYNKVNLKTGVNVGGRNVICAYLRYTKTIAVWDIWHCYSFYYYICAPGHNKIKNYY